MADPFDRQYRFSKGDRYSVGVEEQAWTVHRATGALVPIADRLFQKGYEKEYPNVRRTPLGQQLQAFTPPCKSMRELHDGIQANTFSLHRAARQYGCKISRDPVPRKPHVMGSHPHGAYTNGLHVHVGVANGEEAVRAMNLVRIYLPTLLFLSACSPGTVPGTGLASLRHIKYRSVANGSVMPPYLPSWKAFAEVARNDGFANDPAACWWGVRINPGGTVETRIFDIQRQPEKTLELAAVTRLLVRAAVTGDVVAPPVASGTIDDQLLLAAQGKWDSRDLEKLVRSLAENRKYRDEILAAMRLFPKSR